MLYYIVDLSGTVQACQGDNAPCSTLRDADLGKAVNLVPNGRPADLYQAVTDRLRDQVADDALEGGSQDTEYTCASAVEVRTTDAGVSETSCLGLHMWS